MSPVAIPADKRFHRALVKPARRKGRLRTISRPLLKYGLATAGVALLVYRGGAVVAEAPLLQIDTIVVSGNHRLASDQVLAALNGLRGENIVLSDLHSWRERLLTSRWIQDATFRRSLPSTVEVVVAERDPIGMARVKGHLFLVDEQGTMIDEYGPQYANFDLPIIDGLITADKAVSDNDHERAELAARVIVALRPKPNLARRLSQVDVTDAHNAAVILNGDPAVIYVGEERFAERIESYLDVSAALHERVPDIDYVDLRFDDRIYVRPVGAKARGRAFDRPSVGQTSAKQR